MARQILVALRSRDRLSQMMPYIQQVAQPGTRIVLLTPFSLRAAPEAPWCDSLALQRVEEGRFPGELEEQGFTGRNINAIGLVDEPRLAIERKVILALEALLKTGIELTVDVYAGSLRRVLQSYTRRGDVDLIIKRPGRARSIKRFLCSSFPFFASFKQQTLSPTRLLRVNQPV